MDGEHSTTAASRRYSGRLVGDADFTGFYGLGEEAPRRLDRVKVEVALEVDAPDARD